MISLQDARNLVPAGTQNILWVRRGKKFTTNDIITAVMLADSEAKKTDYTAFARTFERYNTLATLKEVYSFVKFNISYIGDVAYNEIAQKPQTLLHSGRGDCKSFSVLIGSILRALKIPFVYRFVSYDKTTDYTHVYIVATIETQDGHQDIVLDAVPGGGFVTEIPYIKKMDKMPDYGVSVRGLNGKSFYDYTAYTEGEFSLLLIKDHAKELLKHHSDDKQAIVWSNGINLIDNHLFKGIHGAGTSASGSSDFARLINKASHFTQPACGNFIAIKGRNSIRDGIIPLENVSSCEIYKNSQAGFWDFRNNKWVNGSDPVLYDDCQRKIIAENSIKDGLNEHLEDFAARYLYFWEPESSMSDKSGVRFETKYKIADHRRLFKDMVDASNLSPTNMRLWSELGIGRAIAKRGHGVMTPLEGINLLKENSDLGLYDETGAKIGELTLAIALVWCLVIAVSGSVAVAMIQAINKQNPTALGYIDKIMGRGWAAQGQDWGAKTDINSGGSSGSGNTNTNNPPFVKQESWVVRNKKALIGTGVAATGLTAGFLYHNYHNEHG